jgi:hypothetical protein
MEPTKELIDRLWWEEVLAARELTIAQKLALCGDLFDYACQITLSGIRADHPGITDDDAWGELRRRLNIARKLESRR